LQNRNFLRTRIRSTHAIHDVHICKEGISNRDGNTKEWTH
jgi:hypothetical protein